jgi:chaperonin GroES
VFPRSAGVWVEIEDERLLVCRARELLGVIESSRAPEEGGQSRSRGSDYQ